MTLHLQALMREAGIRQADLAAAAGISRPALSAVTQLGIEALPKRYDRTAVETRIAQHLHHCGVAKSHAARWSQHQSEERDMLLRKYRLTHQARQHFELPADPFKDLEDIADVFLSKDIRHIREAMYGAAMHCEFLAVVGESGAGKSTLREELIDRLHREGRDVHVVEPSVLSMAETETKGRPLRVQDIANAIMATVAPTTPLKISRDARERQLKQTLIESHRAGFKHLILIEEAHAIPTATLNHLKRLLEIKDGLRKVLGIVLLGQPELALKLSESNPAVREVVQRIEICTLPPLDNNLEAYLRHRFERAGVPVARVIEQSGIDALRERLAASKQRGMSLLYPQVIHNVLARAMNLAAELGPPRVTADLVRGV